MLLIMQTEEKGKKVSARSSEIPNASWKLLNEKVEAHQMCPQDRKSREWKINLNLQF